MAQPDLLGKTLDRYHLLELIGSGGMGSVYLAEHSRIHKKVAIKVLHPHLADAYPQSVTRMLNEAKAAAAIGHPGIVDVLDYGDTPDGYHYIAMELLDGRALTDLIAQQGGTLAPNLALALMGQVLDALQAAHDKGIVHRDLKPDNIFVHRLPFGGHGIKLLDFGISKFTLDRDARLTATGAVMGTPTYMSLEQVEGRTDVDHRTDIYAIGVILYQCLSGSLPFDGENPNQVMAAILRDPPKPLAALCPGLPAPLADAVMKAMAKDREQRFGSAREFWAALADSYDPQDPHITETLEAFLPNSKAQGAMGRLAATGAATSPSPSLSGHGRHGHSTTGPAPDRPSEPLQPNATKPNPVEPGPPHESAVTAPPPPAGPTQALTHTGAMANAPTTMAPPTSEPAGPPAPPPQVQSNTMSSPRSLPPSNALGAATHPPTFVPPPPPEDIGATDRPRKKGRLPKRLWLPLAILAILLLGLTVMSIRSCVSSREKDRKTAVQTKRKRPKDKKRSKRRSPSVLHKIRRLLP